MLESSLFELSFPGRRGYSLPTADVPEVATEDLLPAGSLREDLPLPELSESDVVRHFTRLSQLNFGVDLGFYPLGSCTMKYNPKVNEDVARLPGFARIHPYQPEESVQGALRLMYELESLLAEITGTDGVTLQPAAGAQGELVGMLMVRAYHRARGRQRGLVIVPDSAHGTNPASAAMAGYNVATVKSDRRGGVDMDELRMLATEDVAAIMLTIPNTLGLFDENILEVTDIVHKVGGLVYCDGANLNALLGRVKPGELGCDIVHLNLHKTFSSPHGGGGPGAGPVAVKKELVPFLPVPVVGRRELDGRGEFYVDYDRPQSVGRVRAFYANFLVLVRAYTYIRALGGEGLRRVSEGAVLNANYLLSRLKGAYDLPYDRACMHEFVLSGRRQKARGVRTLDIAKRLMDFGFHPPTVYFPLIVEEAIMVEPTETESRQTLDAFAEAMLRIAEEVERDPEQVLSAPHSTPVGRVDEVTAARQPRLRWAEAVSSLSGESPAG